MAVAVNDMKVVSLLTTFFYRLLCGAGSKMRRGNWSRRRILLFLGVNKKKVDPRREIDL